LLGEMGDNRNSTAYYAFHRLQLDFLQAAII